MAHLVAYRNRTNISGQHSNERISVHGGRHPNVRIFGSFAGSSSRKADCVADATERLLRTKDAAVRLTEILTVVLYSSLPRVHTREMDDDLA